MHNLTKIFPELLDINGMNPFQRKQSLRRIYDRDIIGDPNCSFRTKKIYPIKNNDSIDIDRNFDHLTTGDVEKIDPESGRKYTSREFEPCRSIRLHWIKKHLQESTPNSDLIIFSCYMRDKQKRKDILRTLIYNKDHKYVVVLEPQIKSSAYYLITAYYLNKSYGVKEIQKMYKRRVNNIE